MGRAARRHQGPAWTCLAGGAYSWGVSSPRDENRPTTLVAFSLTSTSEPPALTATRRAVLAAVGLQGGRIIRSQEPPVAEFRRPEQAFAFAVEALRMVAKYNDRHADSPLDARLGAHYDTVWFVGEDVIGDAPAVAVSLAEAADPGAVLASAAALSRLSGTQGWEITERGRTRLPGSDSEIAILRARPRPSLLEGAPPSPAAGSGAPDAAGPAGGPGAPVPPRPPGVGMSGQEIISGLKEIGRAVVTEIVERSQRQRASGAGAESWRAAVEAVRGEMGDREVPGDLLEQKKKRAARRAGRAIAGFLSHATSWLVVSAGLVALNLITSAGYPWAFFPIAGWGIGLACHWQAVRSARRKNRELKNLESVSSEQLGLVEKIQRAVGGFGAHAAAFLSVNAFLAGVNLVTSSGYLWFFYPLVSWGVGFVLHGVNYLARRRELKRQLAEAGISWADIQAGRSVSGGHRAAVAAGPSSVTRDMEHYELVREARAIRDRLLREISANEQLGRRMGDDAKELLTTYYDQLEKLVLRNDEFRKTVASLPEGSLERELEDYRARIPATEHAVLKREYEKAVEQGERHLKSVRELKQQKEIMGLRIQSSFGLLRQLELDFVRLKNAESTDDIRGLSSIRSKSHEISDYLEGLDEAERQG